MRNPISKKNIRLVSHITLQFLKNVKSTTLKKQRNKNIIFTDIVLVYFFIVRIFFLPHIYICHKIAH